VTLYVKSNAEKVNLHVIDLACVILFFQFNHNIELNRQFETHKAEEVSNLITRVNHYKNVLADDLGAWNPTGRKQ